MMIRSSVTARRGARSGVAARPTFFGCSPQSTRRLRSPSWMNSELAPMPPSRFRSMSFMKRKNEHDSGPKNEKEVWPRENGGPAGGRPDARFRASILFPRDFHFEWRQDHVNLAARL